MQRRRKLPIYGCILLSVYGLRAADVLDPDRFEGAIVRSVRFEPAQQPLTPEQLSSIIPIKPNAPLRTDDLRSAIKKLYATGRYADVVLDAEPLLSGVSLIIRTETQWFIGPVEVRGKVPMPPNRGQLANAARLEMGQPYHEDSLRSATEGIQQLLERNGFYRSEIKPTLERDAEHQQIFFTFVVDSGKRARLTMPTVTGDLRMPEDKVISATKYKGWFRWKWATEETVQTGLQNVRNKYASKDRLTASVLLDGMQYDSQNNRAQPVLKVNGGPEVKIKTEGARVSRRKLKKYVPVFDEGTVNRDLLVQGARNLRDYFQAQGYFDVEVNFETTDKGPDLEEIVYVIAPGERHKLVKVEVEGNRYFSTEDIRERMFLQPAGMIQLRHGRYSAGFERRDENAIIALYRSNGFRDVKVTTQTIDDYQGKIGDVAAKVLIEEGPQYFVSSFKMHGVQQLKAEDLTATLSSQEGEPFSETNVALDRDFIIRQYQSAGFPDVEFDWKTSPGPGPYEVRVEYFITEGKRKYVRNVLLSGMRATRPRLVDPNIFMKSGDPLSWTEMGETQRRLYELGVFDKVDMAIQNPQGDTDHKYVLYHLEEGHRYSVAVGMGAEVARIGGCQTCLSGAAGQTGFAPRASFEVSRLNMWGLGHSLNFKSRYSTLENRVSLNYYAPRYRNVDGRNISVTALYNNSRDVRTFTAKRLEGSAQLSQKLSKPTTAFWRYTWRDVRVDPGTLKISPLLIPQLSQPVHIGMVSGSLIQDRRDDPTNAHRGVFNTLDVGLAERVFGSRPRFVHFLGRSSWYKTMKKTLVLASNTQFGWLGPYGLAQGADKTQAIPLPERFFGGGSTSHRGFPDNQAGPRDPLTGFPIGGNTLLFHSTELRFPFIGANIDGVVFHDFGNVYASPGHISFRVHQKDVTDFDYMVHAVGYGIRYRTPVGPIRLDLAYSLNPPRFMGLKGTYQDLLFGNPPRVLQQVSHFQFFFSIGQAF